MWSLQLYLSQLQWNVLYTIAYLILISLSELVSLPTSEICICCQKILALCAPMSNRNMETELWRRRKEWFYYFARQRGNTVGFHLKNFVPLLGGWERLYRQTGVRDKDQGNNSLHPFCKVSKGWHCWLDFSVVESRWRKSGNSDRFYFLDL